MSQLLHWQTGVTHLPTTVIRDVEHYQGENIVIHCCVK